MSDAWKREYNENGGGIKKVLERLGILQSEEGKLSNFSYHETAYETARRANISSDDLKKAVEGVDEGNTPQPERTNRIPLATEEALWSNKNMLNNGVRSQAASISRMFQNHFIGRTSFNVKLLTDMVERTVAIFASILRRGGVPWDTTTTYEPYDEVTTTNYYAEETSRFRIHRRWWSRMRNTSDMPMEGTRAWQRIRDEYTLPFAYSTSEIDEMLIPGTYQHTIDSGNAKLPAPRALGPDPGFQYYRHILRVDTDREAQAVVTQVIQYTVSQEEFTRTGIITYDAQTGSREVSYGTWFKTKDPRGLQIEGLSGTWALKLNHKGEFEVHYDKSGNSATPRLFILGNVTEDTLWIDHEAMLRDHPELEGQLLWSFGSEYER